MSKRILHPSSRPVNLAKLYRSVRVRPTRTPADKTANILMGLGVVFFLVIVACGVLGLGLPTAKPVLRNIAYLSFGGSLLALSASWLTLLIGITLNATVHVPNTLRRLHLSRVRLCRQLCARHPEADIQDALHSVRYDLEKKVGLPGELKIKAITAMASGAAAAFKVFGAPGSNKVGAARQTEAIDTLGTATESLLQLAPIALAAAAGFLLVALISQAIARHRHQRLVRMECVLEMAAARLQQKATPAPLASPSPAPIAEHQDAIIEGSQRGAHRTNSPVRSHLTPRTRARSGARLRGGSEPCATGLSASHTPPA